MSQDIDATRSLADFESVRAVASPLAWQLFVSLMAVCDPQGRVFRTLGQLAGMVDVRGARIGALLDELAKQGAITWTLDADGGARIQLA